MSENILNTEVRESLISDMPRNVAYCIKANVSAFFWSRPGASKSKVLAQIAKLLGYHLVDLRLSQIESVDLRGIPLRSYECFEIDNDGNIIGKALSEAQALEKKNVVQTPIVAWAMPDFLVDAKKAREKGLNTIFLFDELNHANEENQSAAYQFILEGKIGCFSIHKDDRVLAAGNFENEGSIANHMSVALANRMSHYYIRPDAESWCRWGAYNNINPIILGLVEQNPILLESYPENEGEGKDKGYVTPRTLEQASDLLNVIMNNQDEISEMLFSGKVSSDEFSDELIEENPLLALIKEERDENDIDRDLSINLSGSIGSKSATLLMAYIRTGHKLPNPKDILSGKVKNIKDLLSDYEADEDVNDNSSRPDIQFLCSVQCITALLNEYKKLNDMMASKRISKMVETSDDEFSEARQTFYDHFSNYIIFCDKNLSKDLVVLSITKLTRKEKILPLHQFLNPDSFKIMLEVVQSISINKR